MKDETIQQREIDISCLRGQVIAALKPLSTTSMNDSLNREGGRPHDTKEETADDDD